MSTSELVNAFANASPETAREAIIARGTQLAHEAQALLSAAGVQEAPVAPPMGEGTSTLADYARNILREAAEPLTPAEITARMRSLTAWRGRKAPRYQSVYNALQKTTGVFVKKGGAWTLKAAA